MNIKKRIVLRVRGGGGLATLITRFRVLTAVLLTIRVSAKRRCVDG